MSEKHTIRNGIIVSVISGLILAVVLSAKFRDILLKGVSFVGSAFTGLLAVLGKEVGTPIWLLALLSLLALPLLVRITRLLRNTKKSPENAYTKDRIFGVDWYWVNGYHGVENLYSLCPCCQSELVYLEQRNDLNKINFVYRAEFTQFECENCKFRSEKIPGDHKHAIGSVTREIQRRLRTGEQKPGTEHLDATDG